MQTSDVIFGVASLTFTVSLALPIGLFVYNTEIKNAYGRSLLWLYIPPIISGLAAIISGVLSIITHMRDNWFDLCSFILDIVALIAILIIAVSLPYGIVRLNRILVEKSVEKVYEESLSKGSSPNS